MKQALSITLLLLLGACGGPPEGVTDPTGAPTPFPPGDPQGAVPYLVRDIHPGPSSSKPTALASLNGRLYFAADDGQHGVELWTSDGTAAGTRLLSDICPGPCSSSPHDPLPAHGRLYFAASDGGEPRVWTTDGTDGGTRPLSPAATGPTFPADFVLLGTEVLFLARNAALGGEVWKTDGTATGTVPISDVAPGPDGGLINSVSEADLWVAGGQVFFGGDDRVLGRELWRTDGTPQGTRLVRDILPGQNSSISTLKAAVRDGILYFTAHDGTRSQLWRSDGTLEGTWSLGAPVNQLRPFFAVLGRAVLFAGGSGRDAIRDQLWRSEGTLAGTAVLHSVDPEDIVEFQGAAYFNGYLTDPREAEVWRTDGRPDGTALFKEIRAGAPGSNPQGLSPYGPFLFLAADDGAHGQELWRSDGTPAGTVLVADINPGPGSAFIGFYDASNLVFGLGGRVFFMATDGSAGEELWAYRVPGSP